MHVAAKLELHPFGSDPLAALPYSRQRDYLMYYLADLGAKTVLVEPHYFDRDYLAEFSAFYSVSTKGYPNVCKRLHFFSESLTRKTLVSALSNGHKSHKKMAESYLGFSVIRPIPAAPFGRTVLTWYPDLQPNTPRIKNPSREYTVHIAGLKFSVIGLAWQQQDTGVGACATVGLWTMMHSNAFDDHHAIPTTADITRSAHKTASLGARVFPSSGLTGYQLAEAIKEHKLAPIFVDGDINHAGVRGFSRERFASSCSAFLRSGYPALLLGSNKGSSEGHAVCSVGFREPASVNAAPATVNLQDGHTVTIYVHDDNLGPSVRFAVKGGKMNTPVELHPDPPPPRFAPRTSEPTDNYGPFIPHQIVVGVHEDIRLDPDSLHRAGILRATGIELLANAALKTIKKASIGFWLSTRFFNLSDYLGEELESTIGDRKILSRTRLALYESVAPMSLHIGVVRIALDGACPIVDVLFDTTDSVVNETIFAHVAYLESFAIIVRALGSQYGDFGKEIRAF